MMNAKPATVIGMPIKARSNIFMPGRPFSIIMPWTTRLVEVPISVHNPPRMVAYDNGIKNLVHDRPIFFAQFFTMGAKMTTTGVLLRNAENALTMGRSRNWAFATVVFSYGNSFLTMVLSAPLCLIPSLTRKSNATVIMPRLLNPATICFGVIMPAAINTTTRDNKTMPGRILSSMRATSIPIRPSNTKIISKSIFYGYWHKSTKKSVGTIKKLIIIVGLFFLNLFLMVWLSPYI